MSTNNSWQNDWQRGWQYLKVHYRQGEPLVRLMYIAVGIFLTLALINAIAYLGGWDTSWQLLLKLPADPLRVIKQPWSLITYPLLHAGLTHLLLNMLALSWCNQLFRDYFTGRQAINLFVYGCLGGALLYLAGYSLLPALIAVRQHVYLVGASAGIMALIGAVMVYDPQRPIRLPLVGEWKLLYVCLMLLTLTFLGGTDGNLGGQLAHAGGLAVGLVWGGIYQRHGSDFLYRLRQMWDAMQLRRRQAKETNRTRPQTHNQTSKQNQQKHSDEIEALLKKVRESGYNGLTDEEKRRLFSQSK